MISSQEILKRLQQRVSVTNAKLLLDAARIQAGISVELDQTLEKEQAKTLCMKLINQGGPAFHVGQAIYKEYLM